MFEASGFSGGIWILWDTNVVNIDHISSISQAITLRVNNIGGQTWLLTAVYASTHCHIRNGLWDYLDLISELHHLP